MTFFKRTPKIHLGDLNQTCAHRVIATSEQITKLVREINTIEEKGYLHEPALTIDADTDMQLPADHLAERKFELTKQEARFLSVCKEMGVENNRAKDMLGAIKSKALEPQTSHFQHL